MKKLLKWTAIVIGSLVFGVLCILAAALGFKVMTDIISL